MRAITAALIYQLFSLFGCIVEITSEAESNTCKQCTLLVETFKAGMKKTENMHFAGGNSDWEEKKLGKFAKSETRLVEIMEFTCDTKSLDDSKEYSNVKDLEFQCHKLVEEHEEDIENWYFHKQYSSPNMLLWLCHEKLRLCCKKDYFGSDCKPCPGVDKGFEACSGHGICQGSGTREGNGKCSCHQGYVGFMCSNCDANYYAVQNESNLLCKKCHEACRGGCSDDGTKHCRECGSGWMMNDEKECIDVDECLAENRCQGKHSACVNTAGSYECECELGFKKDSSGICKIDINAQPRELLARPDTVLRIFALTSLCILLAAVIWRRSLGLIAFAEVAEAENRAKSGQPADQQHPADSIESNQAKSEASETESAKSDKAEL